MTLANLDINHPELRTVSTMIKNPSVLPRVIDAGLKPKHFSIEEAGEVFALIVRFDSEDRDFDEKSLIAFVNADKGRAQYIKFLSKCLSEPNVMACVAQIIREYARRNSIQLMLDVAAKMQNMAFDAPKDLPLDLARDFFLGVESLYPESDDVGVTFDTAIDEFWQDVENKLNAGIKTTLPSIDEKASGGWHQNSMITIGGCSGAGKTTYAVQEALHVAKAGRKVVFFTTEMAPKQLAAKMIAKAGGINFKTLMSDEIFDDPTTVRRISNAQSEISKQNILFYDIGHRSSIEFICQKITNLVRRGACDFVVIDYVQILSSDNVKQFKNNRTEELKEICRQIKLCAQRNKIPIMTLAQLNREAEGQIDLKMEHIADSSYIARFSDLVLLLNRKFNEGAQDFRYAYHVVKNRYGPQFVRPMIVNLAMQSFAEHPTVRNIGDWFFDGPSDPYPRKGGRR